MYFFAKLHRLLILAGLSICISAASAPSLSMVRDVVYAPSGAAFSGIVRIVPQGFDQSIQPPAIAVTVEDGMLSVALIPTVSLSATAYYQVSYTNAADGITWSQKWQVPFSTRGLSISDVKIDEHRRSKLNKRSNVQSAGTRDVLPNYVTLPITIDEITGLGAALASINGNIANLQAEATAFNTALASLSAQTGNQTSPVASESSQQVRGEIPSGSINGTNATFSLASIPSSDAQIAIYRNGARQISGGDYTVSGNTITFSHNSIPQTGDSILVDYATSLTVSQLIPSTIVLTFPQTSVGATSTQALTLRNPNTQTVDIQTIQFQPAAPSFSESNTCGTALAGGASCTVTINFVPTMTGSQTIVLNIADSITGSPLQVEISGTAVPAPPVAVLSVSSLDFGGVSISGSNTSPPAASSVSNSNIQTVNLSNPGGVALTVSNISIIGAAADVFSQANTCGSSLPAGGNCQINVSFTPQQLGPAAGHLVVTDNATTAAQAVALSGSGIIPNNGVFKLIAKDGLNCLSSPNTAQGSALGTALCSDNQSQQFIFNIVPSGYEITAKNSGFQLDISGGPSYIEDGQSIILWTYWGGTNEIWFPQYTSDGYVTFVVSSSNKCLTINGGQAQQAACSNSDNQKWTLSQVQ